MQWEYSTNPQFLGCVILETLQIIDLDQTKTVSPLSPIWLLFYIQRLFGFARTSADVGTRAGQKVKRCQANLCLTQKPNTNSTIFVAL